MNLLPSRGSWESFFWSFHELTCYVHLLLKYLTMVTARALSPLGSAWLSVGGRLRA